MLTTATTPASFPSPVAARASGTLVEFDIEEAEAALGVDLDEDLLGDYEGEPALIADSLHYFVDGAFASQTLLDIVGGEVTLIAEVREVVTDRIFLAGERVVVILEEGMQADVVEGAFATAHGTAAVLGEQAESILPGVLTNLPDGRLQEFAGYPVIVADEVTVTR